MDADALRSDREQTAIRSRNAGIGLGYIVEGADAADRRWGAFYGVDEGDHAHQPNTVAFDGITVVQWRHFATQAEAAAWLGGWVTDGEGAL